LACWESNRTPSQSKATSLSKVSIQWGGETVVPDDVITRAEIRQVVYKNIILTDSSQLSMPFEKKGPGPGATIAPGTRGCRWSISSNSLLRLWQNLQIYRVVILSAAKNLVFPGSC
jgi:hypothetical protein